MKSDVLKTQRLTIRPTGPQDLADLMTWWNDPQVMQSVGFPEGLGMTPMSMQEWYADWVERQDTSRKHFIIVAGQGTAIGEIHYRKLDELQKSAWIGIKIGRMDYHGKGFGKEAILGFLRYLFSNLDLNTIYLDVRADNVSALRLYQSVGFVITSSQPSDYYDMALTRVDFLRKNDATS